MCQDDMDAPAQGHPHPHAGISQKIKLKQCDPWGTQGMCHWIHIIILKNNIYGLGVFLRYLAFDEMKGAGQGGA